VEAVLDELHLDGDVVELGCGTGHWTVRLAATARSVRALDGSAEMLEQARRKLPDLPRHDHVTLEVVDLVRAWDPPPAQWDAAVACFFLEHVPDDDLDPLLAKVARGLRPGGVVFVAEGRHHGDVADSVEHRHLNETSFRVVERRRTPDELTAAFARHGIDVAVETTDHLFVVATGHKA
jgi:ubiquinone/menaquinone biosynthesis C-methylase UbiE